MTEPAEIPDLPNWEAYVEAVATGKINPLHVMQALSREAIKEKNAFAFVQYARASHVLLQDHRAALALHRAITQELDLRFPDHDSEGVQQQIIERQAVRRFDKLSGHQSDAFADQPSLLSGKTFEECLSQYHALLRYVEDAWAGACDAFRGSKFSLATFLSIVVIEEIAKLGRLWFDLLAYDQSAGVGTQGGKIGKRHKHKHFMTVIQGALINHRLDRIFGRDTMQRFLSVAESGRLEELRQSCIYFSSSGGGVVLPDDVVDRETARNLCALSGELMAEILGHFPWDFDRMLKAVSGFEIEAGFSPEIVRARGD